MINPSHDIVNPQVLIIMFDETPDGWQARIPHAYGYNEDAIFPISTDLSLQFQPIKLKNILLAEEKVGVICFPLVSSPKDDEV